MKKIIAAILLSVFAMASLTACGSTEKKADASSAASSSSENVTEAAKNPLTKEALVGTWELTNTKSRKDGSYSKLVGNMQETFVFSEDGKYKADGKLFTLSGTYSFDADNNLLTHQDGTTGETVWSYDSEKAELSYQASGDMDYVFTKK